MNNLKFTPALQILGAPESSGLNSLFKLCTQSNSNNQNQTFPTFLSSKTNKNTLSHQNNFFLCRSTQHNTQTICDKENFQQIYAVLNTNTEENQHSTQDLQALDNTTLLLKNINQPLPNLSSFSTQWNIGFNGKIISVQLKFTPLFIENEHERKTETKSEKEIYSSKNEMSPLSSIKLQFFDSNDICLNETQESMGLKFDSTQFHYEVIAPMRSKICTVECKVSSVNNGTVNITSESQCTSLLDQVTEEKVYCSQQELIQRKTSLNIRCSFIAHVLPYTLDIVRRDLDNDIDDVVGGQGDMLESSDEMLLDQSLGFKDSDDVLLAKILESADALDSRACGEVEAIRSGVVSNISDIMPIEKEQKVCDIKTVENTPKIQKEVAKTISVEHEIEKTLPVENNLTEKQETISDIEPVDNKIEAQNDVSNKPNLAKHENKIEEIPPTKIEIETEKQLTSDSQSHSESYENSHNPKTPISHISGSQNQNIQKVTENDIKLPKINEKSDEMNENFQFKLENVQDPNLLDFYIRPSCEYKCDKLNNSHNQDSSQTLIFSLINPLPNTSYKILGTYDNRHFFSSPLKIQTGNFVEERRREKEKFVKMYTNQFTQYFSNLLDQNKLSDQDCLILKDLDPFYNNMTSECNEPKSGIQPLQPNDPNSGLRRRIHQLLDQNANKSNIKPSKILMCNEECRNMMISY